MGAGEGGGGGGGGGCSGPPPSTQCLPQLLHGAAPGKQAPPPLPSTLPPSTTTPTTTTHVSPHHGAPVHGNDACAGGACQHNLLLCHGHPRSLRHANGTAEDLTASAKLLPPGLPLQRSVPCPCGAQNAGECCSGLIGSVAVCGSKEEGERGGVCERGNGRGQGGGNEGGGGAVVWGPTAGGKGRGEQGGGGGQGGAANQL
jgi:hypothetical protein